MMPGEEGGVLATALLPTGTVTFLLTDVEGSTRLWEQDPDAMGPALTRHDELIDSAVAAAGGEIVRPRGEGDSRFAVFARASDAVVAALEIQRALHTQELGVPLRVRLALHTGEAALRAGDYYGPSVNRCARLRAIAHGGQTLISHTTEELVRDALPAGVVLKPLGAVRLKDLSRVENVLQLCHPDLPDTFQPLRSVDTYANNLPLQLTNFVGRDAEVPDVRALLADSRLVTLTGAGGCGKTRLALAIAAESLEDFEGGVWFVDLSAVTDPDAVPSAIASALKVHEEPDRPALDAVAAFAGSSHLLIVFDNCEHLLAASAHAAEYLLRACSALTVLATSREGLGVAGEVSWRVPSLSVPDRGAADLEALSMSESAQLFLDRARAVAPAAVFTDEDASAIAQICGRLDGIPLAVELAAARADVLTPDRIAARLDDRFKLLTGGGRNALERQQTLRATLDWSHGLLSEEERLVFRRASVFVGGFTLDAAEEICAGGAVTSDAVLDHLGMLVRKSLVVTERIGRDTWYRLMETMRQYAREKLFDADEGTQVRDAHAAWYAAFALRSEPELEGADQIAWYERLGREHDNLRAAMDWSFGNDAPAAGQAIAAALGAFWATTGAWTEGRSWITRAMESPDVTDELRGCLLAHESHLAYSLRQFEDAERAADVVLAAEGVGSARPRLIAMNIKAIILFARGRDVEARALTARCLDDARAAGDGRMETLALYRHFLGDQGNRYLDEALALARARADVSMIANLLTTSATRERLRGNDPAAIACAEEALALARALGHRQMIASLLVSEAWQAHDVGDAEAGQAGLRAAAALAAELGGVTGKAMSLQIAANEKMFAGDLKAALPLWDQVRSLLVEAGDLGSAEFAATTLGLVAMHIGDDAYARRTLDDARALVVTQDPGRTTRLNLNTAILDLRQGDLDPARARLDEAAPWAFVHGLGRLIAFRMHVYAWLASARGDHARAAGLMGAATAIDDVPWTTFFVHVSSDRERWEAVARDGLGEEAFQRLYDEGRALSRDEAVALGAREAGIAPETLG